MDTISIDKNSKLLNLEELFENRLFEIPDYQRGYSWEERQVNDLMEDIEHVIQQKGDEFKHFTGTIVATPKATSRNVFEIIDGQQRLLTILILLSCIVEKDTEKYGSLVQKYLKSGAPGRQLYKFTPNTETRLFFIDYVINSNKLTKAELKSHENIKNAKKILGEWIEKKAGNLDSISNVVQKMLGFLLYCPENNSEIGIMFEVINNRGKRLSELEKIKNYFIYISTVYGYPSLRDTVNRIWSDILRNLSVSKQVKNEDENSFLRNCYLVFFEVNKEKSWKVYDQLKKRFDPNEGDTKTKEYYYEEITRFIDFLKHASYFYACFKDDHFFQANFPDDKNKYIIGSILKYLRCHPENASIMPLYLAVTAWVRDNDALKNMLDLIEKLNFRIYVLPKITNRADSKQGELFKWANVFYNNHVNKQANQKDLLENLTQNIKAFTKDLCSEENLVKSLTLDKDEKDDYTNWNGKKYFLGRYEEQLQSSVGRTWNLERILTPDGPKSNDILSIEHIWARKNRTGDFPEDFLEKRRLGNLILVNLGRNISLQNEDIPEKIMNLKQMIKENKLIELVQFNDFYSNIYPEAERKVEEIVAVNSPHYYPILSQLINDTRETKLIEFALKTWLFEDEKTTVFKKVDSFTDQNQTYILKKHT